MNNIVDGELPYRRPSPSFVRVLRGSGFSMGKPAWPSRFPARRPVPSSASTFDHPMHLANRMMASAKGWGGRSETLPPSASSEYRRSNREASLSSSTSYCVRKTGRFTSSLQGPPPSSSRTPMLAAQSPCRCRCSLLCGERSWQGRSTQRLKKV